MDGILGEERVFDGEEQDFKYILDSDVFHNVPITDPLGSLSSSSYYDDYDYLFDDDPMLATTDKMAPASPHITTDHCYSMASQPSSPLALDIKQEDDLDSDFDRDGLEDMLPVSPENEVHHLSLIGDHGIARSNQEEATPTGFLLTLDTLGGKSLLTNNGTIINQQGLPTATHMLQQKQEGSKIKLELVTTMLTVDNGLDTRLQLPPTPPGSTASDSDGGESPQRSLPSSPRALPAIKPATKPICHARNLTPQLFTNIQKLPQSGPLMLTEEEKRTLRQEGYPIPTKLPLTKSEEKALKKVRRKIKNKISAQESRRKKKEYLDSLEKRMDSYTSENNKLRQKVDTLETTNQSLLSQLTKLQSIVNKISKPLKANTTQTGTCLMVLVLCFAVFLGSWSPHSFLNSSSQRLPRLFSPSHSHPTSQMPNPYYNPYDDAAMDIDDDTDPIFRAYGPNLASDSDDSDPYGTKSMRSSRTLLSYDEHDDDLYSDLHRYHHDLDSEASLEGRIKPQIPSGFGAGLVAGVSDVGNLESDKGLEAYMMHPDMEVKIIPTDTMALINRSSNK